jgi:hypothetical protein
VHFLNGLLGGFAHAEGQLQLLTVSLIQMLTGQLMGLLAF